MDVGYRELSHTADWQLEAWGPDLAALLEQSAHGMCEMAGVQLAPGPRQNIKFTLTAWDVEGLLVKFLGELLYWQEQFHLGFDTFDLKVSGNTLEAQLSGTPVVTIEKQIKAVTYHDLAIRKTERGLEVRVVFDV